MGVPNEIARLAGIADALGRRAPLRKSGPAGSDAKPWPRLWLFTDPVRTPDLLAAAGPMPEGSGVVLRTFGQAEAEAQAPALAAFARANGLVLLVGADARLAKAIGADGLHLPERMAAHLPPLRALHPAWRFTVAAHDAAALQVAAEVGADAAFLSPILPSLSPSAGEPLGVEQTTALVRGARLPVYGLGGIDAETASGLMDTGLAGLAGVGFARPAATPRT